jgi:hypothetical protein
MSPIFQGLPAAASVQQSILAAQQQILRRRGARCRPEPLSGITSDELDLRLASYAGQPLRFSSSR